MRLRLAGLAVALLLTSSCAAEAPGRDGFALSYRIVPVEAVEQPGPWQVTAMLDLSGPPGFGGVSDLLARPDGAILAVQDNGAWLGFTPGYDRDGRLVRVTDPWTLPIADDQGSPLTDGGKARADAEAMAAMPDGRIALAFERDHRLTLHPTPEAPAQALDAPPALATLPENGGIEAMVHLPDGRLLLLAERGADATGLPAFLRDANGTWTELRYPFDGAYRPTGATLGPDGRIFVLERAFSIPAGPRGRIQELTLEGTDIRLTPIAFLRTPIPVDNAEGITWLPDPPPLGSFLVISDDNFSALQRTFLWQLRP